MLIMSHQSDKGHLPHLARVFWERNIPYNWVVSDSWKILSYVTFSKTQKQLFFPKKTIDLSLLFICDTHGGVSNDFLQANTSIVCQYENKTVTQMKEKHTFISCYVARQICLTVINIKKNLSVSVIFKKINELLLCVRYKVHKH